MQILHKSATQKKAAETEQKVTHKKGQKCPINSNIKKTPCVSPDADGMDKGVSILETPPSKAQHHKATTKAQQKPSIVPVRWAVSFFKLRRFAQKRAHKKRRSPNADIVESVS